MKCPSTTKSMMFRSRLDWYQQSAMPLQTPQRSTWHCGDRQKRKQAVSQFAKYSSLHGVHFICSSDSKTSKVKKILFRVFFAFCMLSTLSNVAFLTQESWFTESVYITTTSKEGWNGPVEDPQFPRHPRITFCRRPAYRIHAGTHTEPPHLMQHVDVVSALQLLVQQNNDDAKYQELVEYALISLGYPFVSLTPQETALMIGIKAYKMQHPGKSLLPDLNAMQLRLDSMEKRYDKFKSNEDSFNLTQFIVDNSARSDEIFIRCIALVFDLNCTQIFHPVLTSMGTCFSVFVADIAESIESMDLKITLIFDLHAAPELDKAMDVGYQIYLSDPRNRDGMINSAAETLINGYTTVVKTTLTKTSRTAQFTPWHGLYTQCPRLPQDLDPMDYGDRFFKAACEKRYLEKLMNKHCRCRYVTDLSITSEPQCDPVAVYDCFAAVALFDNLTGMAHTCGFPCIEYGYESEVSLVKIGDQNIRLVFVYDGKQYSLREYRKTTLSSFLSQIGGALGLYLGASIITVVEMVTFAFTWLWYTCAPSKRKSSPVTIHRKGSKKHYCY